MKLESRTKALTLVNLWFLGPTSPENRLQQSVQQKEDERTDSIAGLASLEQRIMGESPMTQAARPPSSQVRKIMRTYSVHDLQTMESENLPGMRKWIAALESLLICWTFAVATVVNQMESVPMDHGGSKRKKMIAPKPKL